MRFLLFIFYILIVTRTNGQEIQVSKLSQVDLTVNRYIGTDQYNAIYCIDKNRLIKVDQNKKLDYFNFSLGKITTVDIQNPLKILVFYKNFNTAVLLDNQLNEIQRINFSELNPALLADAIGQAAQNKIWVFDENTRRLGVLDLNSLQWKSLGTPFDNAVKTYSSNFNYFFWIDENNQFYQCDLYGKISKLGIQENSDQILFIQNHQILYKIENQLYWKDLKSNSILEVKINEKSIESFSYKEQILTIFTNQVITNYKITIP